MRARRTTTVLAATVLPLVLAGCGVALDPQTYKERSTKDAANASIGGLALRNVGIEPPDPGQSELGIGKDAQVTLSVVSVAADADTFVSVSTPAAASASFVDSSGHAVTSVEVPANGSIGFGGFGIVLRGLTKPLRPGMYVEMTFVFDHAGKGTLKVPVRGNRTPVPRDSFEPKPAEG